MDENAAIQAFDALSRETRLRVLRLLIQAGPEGIPAGEIGMALGVRQNTMSVNLKILAQAKLINSLRDGRVVRYAASYDTISGLILFLLKDCCGGRAALCQPVLDQVRCVC
jgi:ArsR family transcriptional regulator, arsenate/arsenite/antimonite-responsive transcriptional repressor